MKRLRITLIGEGPTDEALLCPIKWLLLENRLSVPVDANWADLRALPQPPDGMTERIQAALDHFPCDLLFVHRDADRESRESRVQEIRTAIARMETDAFRDLPNVCVIPVRMTEAWFLFDERAIRQAAGNPAGRVPLDLPNLSRVEDLPDPKAVLSQLIDHASELPRRRRGGRSPGAILRRLAELTSDYQPLRRLNAFALLEEDIRRFLHTRRLVGRRYD